MSLTSIPVLNAYSVWWTKHKPITALSVLPIDILGNGSDFLLPGHSGIPHLSDLAVLAVFSGYKLGQEDMPEVMIDSQDSGEDRLVWKMQTWRNSRQYFY